MEETALLKKEIERQNQIIGILIDQIGILKSQNAAYLNVIKANDLGSTIAGKDNGSADFGSTIAGKGNTPPEFGSTIAEKGNTPPEFLSTIAEKGNTPPEFLSTIAEKGNASPEFGSTIAEKGNASPGIGSTIAGKVTGQIQINMASEGKLSRALLKYYPVSIKRMALESIARQLLLLNNTGKTSRKELFKISRLSTPGFKKAIPKLVKRGLVNKTGYQEYELGQLSKNIIAKTFGVTE